MVAQPVILALWEAEAEGLQFQAQAGQLSNKIRPSSQNKKIKG